MWSLIQERLSDAKYADIPIVIAGDFNSMSHLDYIKPFRNQFDGVAIDWPTSHILSDVGFRDAWREIHPKSIARRIGHGHHAFLNNNRIVLILFITVVPGWKSEMPLLSTNILKNFPPRHAALVTEFSWCKPTSSQSLRLVSYNIKHGLGNDGRIDLERTAALLNNLHADFIGLQEVDNKVRRSGMIDQAQTLGKSSGTNSAFGSFMDYQGGKYGLGVLSKYPILAANEIKLPTGNEPRVALAL